MSEFNATRRGFLGSAAAGAVAMVAPKNSGLEISVPDVEARSGQGWELDGLAEDVREKNVQSEGMKLTWTRRYLRARSPDLAVVLPVERLWS